MDDFAIAHVDGIDEFPDGRSHYRPIRHHLGISAFGVTAWVGHATGDVVIDEHEEGDPTKDEELFLVFRGHASFLLGGQRVDAPAGTLVRARPSMERTASAKEPGTVIIAIEGTPGRAYDARGWELWSPLAPLYDAGRYAEVADRLRAVVETSPQYPMLFFNLACCESLSGEITQALRSLRRSIEMSEEFRERAKEDPDLDPLRGEDVFRQLIGG